MLKIGYDKYVVNINNEPCVEHSILSSDAKFINTDIGKNFLKLLSMKVSKVTENDVKKYNEEKELYSKKINEGLSHLSGIITKTRKVYNRRNKNNLISSI